MKRLFFVRIRMYWERDHLDRLLKTEKDQHTSRNATEFSKNKRNKPNETSENKTILYPPFEHLD